MFQFQLGFAGALSSPASHPTEADFMGSLATTSFSTKSHAGHSNRRCSKPIGPGLMRASIMRDVQCQQRGRSMGPVEGASSCRDRATARCEDICNSSYRPKSCTSSYTMAVRDVDHGNVTEPAWPPYTSKLHPPHLTSV